MPTLLPILLAAASTLAPDVTGKWDLKAGEATIFRLEIAATPTGTTATWERPEHFETDGESFTRLTGPTIRRTAQGLQSVEGNIELVFDDPRPGAMPDRFRLHRVDADHVDMAYMGTGFEPFALVRAAASSPKLGPWDADRTYVRTILRPTNAEMTAMFDADQAARRTRPIDWSVVGPADIKRRARTQELLDTGKLQSGEDYFNAAFIFQHGSTADDYLKAHILAMIAIARGRPAATWIASATLDRYLWTIGKPQMLGTQYQSAMGSPFTQEPYDRKLVSDGARKALGVRSLVEQEEQRRYMDETRPGPRGPGN